MQVKICLAPLRDSHHQINKHC